MDNAAAAVTKLFGKGSTTNDAEQPSSSASTTATKSVSQDVDADTTVEAEVKPAVEHTHVKKAHETREQTFIEREKHQDHYHTTIQPLKDSEVLPEKHDYQQEKKEKNINRDDGTARQKAENDTAGYQSTIDEKKFESQTKEPTIVDEHVHHHLHETVQPVIEKEVLDPSVTHKKIEVKENIKEQSKHHGVTTNSAMSVDEFQKKLNQETK
ncbi:hypothetical protein ONS95_013297 [Cadophora gregata]|uniref:uncharacterized protein n=1 Tax=Cadophora gregata TaxID=51156 RepID=UPI0026DD00E4|nr:uncharacterized protein ONS95_013297 [Cadophora gregata]KAK0099878.1 hypothetical protein ONS96_007828 [Cadophora gregata f. sp. sojae]KAK0116271.1 hypothetical protein ONS95_013297 [Cadophora gregata]